MGYGWPRAGGAVSTKSLRPAYDAHHVYAWKCESTDGTLVAPDVGAVSLSGGGGFLATQTGPIYRGCPSLVNTNTSEESRVIAGAIEIDLDVTSYTLEVVSYVSQWIPHAAAGWGSYPVIVGIIGTGPTRGHQIRAFNGSSPGALVSTAWVAGGGANETSYTVGAGYTNVSIGAHHFMVAWNKATATSSVYIDGKVVKSGAGESITGKLTEVHVAVPSFGGSIADLRISDIARDQAYALAATRALRQM